METTILQPEAEIAAEFGIERARKWLTIPMFRGEFFSFRFFNLLRRK
jgi:hypothetical protein